MTTRDELIKDLNGEGRDKRLKAIRYLEPASEAYNASERRDTNNHIHSKYSFSPYYPSKAAWLAFEAGLATAGIVDHDSCAGAKEFIEAAAILGLPVTTGIEVRVDMGGTKLKEMRLNNQDQNGNAYVTLQGLPHQRLNSINEFLAPYRKERCLRTQKMAEGIGAILQKHGIPYSFENDVLPISQYQSGGTITERHMLYALALRIIQTVGKGEGLSNYLIQNWNINVPDKTKMLLDDPQNPHYEYDMLGLLKAEFLDKVYIAADRECPKAEDLLKLSKETGAIPAYCYLGDQNVSVTGDKKAMEFEDRNLETILYEAKAMGFKAVEYMPTRNTDEQIVRLKEICRQLELFEICGEDINQPRQKFICEKMRKPLFEDAYDCSWALVGHELSISQGGEGLLDGTKLEKRITGFAEQTRNEYHAKQG